MFDDLRKSASVNLDEEEFKDEDFSMEEPEQDDEKLFLGMTAPQRFIIAVVVLLMSCVLGGFCLVLTGKIYLPF